VRAGDHEIRERAPLQLGSALERPPLIARNPRLPAARLALWPWSYLACHIPWVAPGTWLWGARI